MFRNRFLLILGMLSLLLIALAVVPSIAVSRPVPIPLTGISEYTDYYQRHPTLRGSAALQTDRAGDFYLGHPEWASNAQNAAIPVTGHSDVSDYFQRHRDLNASIEMDRTNLYRQYPGAWVSRAAGVDTELPASLERPGMACESPVDCR